MTVTADPMVAPTMTIGEKGRVVIPAAIREAHGWEPGTKLIAIETEDGVIVRSVEETLAWLRGQLRARYGDRSMVDELIADRRAEVERERQADARWQR